MGSVVEHVGIEIRAVGPDDRSRLTIDTDLCEKVRVLKRREHPASAANPRSQVNRPLQPVRETQDDDKG